MDLGFETIGNATLICHDGGPVLVTDPWVVGSAYFGSWTRSHEIPEAQMSAILGTRHVWLSHGHPDHLSSESLELLRGKKILLADHVGARVATELRAQGFDVRVLPDREWIELSPRIRVLCIADYNQDGILLVDIGGRLVVNLNDAGDRGWGGFVRNTVKRYAESYLLCLSGFGDADMINFFAEDGAPIPPPSARRTPVGERIARLAELYGVRFFAPFSSMHRYQRRDSLWASRYTTTLSDYAQGFASTRCELLPAFIRRDLAADRLERIDPPETPRRVLEPKAFGDDWTETLEPAEAQKVGDYFRAVEHLREVLDFVEVQVGGRDHRIELNRGRFRKGITFEVPRRSLLTAVEYHVFDDLLIGNFMRTTLHGDFGPLGLYPDFSPYVAKYADNGQARTPEELRRYFHAYRRRDPLDFLRAQLDARCVRPLQEGAARVLREALGPGSRTFRATKDAYWALKRHLL